MILKFLMDNPVILGLFIMLLMWSDYLLTLLQEKERKEHYYKHYQSYPINTIEGNPAFIEAVSKLKAFNPKHFIATLIIGAAVPIALFYIPESYREIFIGYVLGIFFIVDAQHLNNLIGYRFSRKGLHGKLFLHQRTGALIQSARYLSITILLLFLSIISGSQIIYGATIAGLTSALRLFLLSKKVVPIEKEDLSPENISIE